MIFTNFNFLTRSLLLFIFFFILSGYKNNKTNILYDGFTISYDVSFNQFHLGVSEHQLIQKSTNSYTHKALIYATGIVGLFVKDKVTGLSHYQILKNKIVPSRYDYNNSNQKRKDNYSIIFDNKNNTVTRTNDNIKHNITDNKQDILSLLPAIMLALQRKDQNIKFTVIDSKRIGEYLLKQTKDETLKTDKGEIKTQILESRVRNNKYHFILWCAKKYDFLPIKIKRIKDNGDELLLKLNRINGQEINFIEPPDKDDEDEFKF